MLLTSFFHRPVTPYQAYCSLHFCVKGIITERTQSQMRNAPGASVENPQVPPSVDLPPCARGQDEHPLPMTDTSV